MRIELEPQIASLFGRKFHEQLYTELSYRFIWLVATMPLNGMVDGQVFSISLYSLCTKIE